MSRSLLLLAFVLVFGIALSAQEVIYEQSPELSKEETERKIPPKIDDPVYKMVEVKPLKNPEQKVCPPSWWTGMENNELELLIYGPNAGKSSAKIKKKGIRIKKTETVENPNYLFLTIEINDNAEVGHYPIILRKGLKKREYSFYINGQKEWHKEVKGLSQSDLIYLIMPDRFANGDYSNDSFDDMSQSGIDRRRIYYRHGGDIKGIIDNLDYVKNLGATALWLNPVLENDRPFESYHGYAYTNHYEIDKRFGNNELYRTLSKKANEKGIKLIKDVVYNQTGMEHWFIEDLPEHSWLNQQEEFIQTSYRAPTIMDPYAADIDKHRMTDGWFTAFMPDLNHRNPHVANFLTQHTLWWIEYASLEGLRVDTYAYCDAEYMAKWGKRMYEEYPNMSIFGETWVHGPGVQSWFTDNNPKRDKSYLPGVTDFQIYYAINEALSQEQGWTEGIARLYYTLAQDYLYADPTKNVLFLDNHDVSRFLSGIDNNFEKFKSGIVILMTLRGIPMLYYGTEILMDGVTDPDGYVRQDFPGGWKEDSLDYFNLIEMLPEHRTAHDFVRKIASLRKDPSLSAGRFKHFIPEDDVYTYFRYNEEKTWMIMVNTGSEEKNIDLNRFSEMIGDSEQLKDALTGKVVLTDHEIHLTPFQSRIFSIVEN